MSFWGNTETPQNGSMDMGGGDFEPIPANTQVLATADEATWKEYEDKKYINIKWTVLAPEEYKNRVVFHKLHVLDSDPGKAQRHKQMLAAIDSNASGGKLMQSGEAPTDGNMAMTLCHSPMYLKLQTWDMNGKSGNWVCAVAPKDSKPEEAPQPNAAPDSFDSFDEDVPF